MRDTEEGRMREIIPQFPLEMSARGIPIIIDEYGEPRYQGSYPFDPLDSRLEWEKAVPITEEMVRGLLKLPEGATLRFLNKAYVEYAQDHQWVYAMYLHDWGYSIIRRRGRSKREEFPRGYGK